LSGPISVEERGPLRILRFNRPQVRNALDLETWRGLRVALEGACSRSDPKSVVALAGSGGFFSAGDDIRAMRALSTPGEAARFFGELLSAFEALLSCGKPTMAVVEGPATGGGAELLLAVDYTIAARGAWLSYPEAYLALIPPGLATLGFVMLGRRAWRLAATGETLTAEEAARLGIIDEVVEPGDAWRRALEVAERLSQLPYGIMASVRRASLRAFMEAFRGAVADLESLVLGRPARERMDAFIGGARWVVKPGGRGGSS